MINKYIVYSRYEYFGPDGKGLTNWFSLGKFFDTEDDANDFIKQMKLLSDETDKIMKLKHFYETRYIDITTLPIPTYHFQTKGRPSKEELQKREEYYAHYWDKYK